MKVVIQTPGVSLSHTRTTFVEYAISRGATHAAFGPCEIGPWKKPTVVEGREDRVTTSREVTIASGLFGHLFRTVFPGTNHPVTQTVTSNDDGIVSVRTSFFENGFVAFYDVSEESGGIVVTSGVTDDEPESCLPFGLVKARTSAGTKAAARAVSVCDHLSALIDFKRIRVV